MSFEMHRSLYFILVSILGSIDAQTDYTGPGWAPLTISVWWRGRMLCRAGNWKSPTAVSIEPVTPQLATLVSPLVAKLLLTYRPVEGRRLSWPERSDRLATCDRGRVGSISHKSVVVMAGAARSHAPISEIYLHSGGKIITGKHVSDTCTMCWEIYCIHPQSGHTSSYARR